MRYPKGIVVMVPWLDTNNERNYSRFTFKGDVDRRKVRRHIRRALKTLGMHARKWWIDHHIRARSYEPTS